MNVTLDTCVLKLATLPHPSSKSAVIVELCLREIVHAYVTPDVLAEYQRVLYDHPLLLEQVQAHLSNDAARDGESYTVPNPAFHECPDCGERLYDRDAMRKIEAHSPAYAKPHAAR